MEKVPPSEKLSKEIEQLYSGTGENRRDLLEELIEKSVRMVMQKILEQEVSDYLGRGYYERNSESHRGYRNGYEGKKLKTAEGKVHLDMPQVRGAKQTYGSEFLKNLDSLSPGLRHLAIAIGFKALYAGYTLCFERMNNLVKLLKTYEIQRESAFRINRILRSDVLVIDEIGYTPIDRKEANLFFNLVSELYERSSVIITSNKDFEEWAEMMGDQIMTTAMLDRLLHHAQVFSLSGDSYRIQPRKEE